ncbi:Cysteine desulfurase [uncultured archaeon]|nr:Cysteine desulfurase [uncultured archaeon]
MVSRGLDWKRGDRIVVTLLEHHSNLLPWMRLKEEGVEMATVMLDKEGRLDLADFEQAITPGTRLVAVSQLSNALGSIIPVKEIASMCRDAGTSLLVDAAQSVPHMPVSAKEIDCDFLCFSGHKMLGPTGSGVLWMKSTAGIEPLLAGGGMVEEVHESGFDIKPGFEGYEAGTPDISAAIGLGAAMDYLSRVGLKEIHDHERRLTRRLLAGLAEIKGVRIFGPETAEKRGGVVSFGVDGLLPHEVALMLDQTSSIMVRSGHHCCIPLMKHLGLKYGTVRASLYLYNTIEEVEKLLAALEQIARMA